MRPYLRVANVFEDRIDISDVHEMHFSDDEASAYRLEAGDILLNEGQSPHLVGRPAIFRDEIVGACFQNTLLRFRAGPAVIADFALLIFRHYLHAGVFMKVAQWSTNIAHLSKTRFVTLPFPVPPLSEQKRIAREARARLNSSEHQRTAIDSSLAQLPLMIDQLFGAAINGSLIPQNAGDEPAVTMLARLGPVPTEIADPSSDEEIAPVTIPVRSDQNIAASIVEILRSSGRAMTLPDLCFAAGFDRNSVGDIESFYVALRKEVGATIRVIGPETENAMVEALDAPG